MPQTEQVVAFARGSFGDLIRVLQSGLTRLGHYSLRIDGDFGGGTEAAVRSLQIDRGVTPTGRAGIEIWQIATGMPWPQLFERCLQLTARFEGHGYQLIAGNFDGAGLTWGIIGFTLKHGEIQAIVNEIATRAPDLLHSIFGSETNGLIGRFQANSVDALIEWADSISTGKKKQLVQEPWRSGFAALGAHPLVQEIQRRRARENYFDGATATATRLNLVTELGHALCFDIHVQNGGLKKTVEASFRTAVAKRSGPRSERKRRELLARLVAASAKKAFQQDVLSRKQAIAVGAGIVHGQFFQLSNWGLDESQDRSENR